MQAIVAEARRAGRKVAAHAHGAQSIKEAIRAGVDSIEHASLIDDEGIALSKQHGTTLVFDIYVGDFLAQHGEKIGILPEWIEKEKHIDQVQRESFRRANRAGARIAFGTDSGGYPHGDNAKQFAKMVEWGMKPIEAIRAATITAAELLGWSEKVGSIEPGRHADLIAVVGDPLEDVGVLESVKFVMKDGVVVRNDLRTDAAYRDYRSLDGLRTNHVPESPPAKAYQVVHGWPSLPEGHILGQATGVAVDTHNHVLVFHRAGREWREPFPNELIESPTIMMFDGDSGALLAEWGEDLFVMPHGLAVDEQNNIWVTDVGRHQVFKFTHDGSLLLTVGTAMLAGADSSHFNRPTDVAVSPSGKFYVSDGYTNTRVVKFSSTGQFEFQWGTRGSGPGQFDLPHGIALDDEGRVFVADRGNARVQVFNAQGRFLSEWKSKALGTPYAVAIGANARVYVIDGGDQPKEPPDRSRALRLKMNGTIEAIFGQFGNYDGQFRLDHDIEVGNDDAVYVVDAWGMRVQKFVTE